MRFQRPTVTFRSLLSMLLAAFLASGVLTAPPVGADPPVRGIVSVSGGVADDVLGQFTDSDLSLPDFTTNGANDSADTDFLNSPQGVAVDASNHRLFVADTGNNRVLVFNLTDGNLLVSRHAIRVLGQPNFEASAGNLGASDAAANTLFSPWGLAYDATGNRLFVADSFNRRVLVFDTANIDNGENAVRVLGQADFTSSAGSTTRGGLGFSPFGSGLDLAYDSAGNRLFVSDPGNNRVLAYDVAAITNGQDASNVLGQALFTTNDSATTQGGLSSPTGLAYDATGSRLFVADTLNNRVLVYDVVVIANGENAVNVLGQAVFTTSASATTQSGLNGPSGLAFAPTVLGIGSQGLAVADTSNHRIVVFDVIGAVITDGESAANVLGQANFTSASINRGGSVASNSIRLAQGLAFDGVSNLLWAADNGNHRVLGYDVTGIADGEAAVDLVGQVDSAGLAVFTTGFSNGGANSRGLSSPMGLALDATHHRLFVADAANARVLVYNLDPANRLLDRLPDAGLGKAGFPSNPTGSVNQAELNGPSALVYDSTGNRLFVADTSFSRVVVYDVETITNGEDAVNVLGQANFTSSSAAIAQGGLNAPQGLAYDSGASRLFVSDFNSNRVLVYDVATLTDGENAVNVLGQANFTSGGAATTQSGLNGPLGMVYDSGANRLFVSDFTNNRVLVYDVAAITNGENAVNVLGQANFTSGFAATSPTRLTQPHAVAFDPSGRRLLVADYSNSRVVTYDVETISNGEAAVAVLGQADPTSSTPNRGTGIAANTLSTPASVEFDPSTGILYVGDYGNNRALLFNASLAGGAIAINGNAAYANSITTTLSLTATNATTALLSESPAFTGASFQPYTTTSPFTMTVGDGAKTVYARFRDSALDPSATVSDTIILDTTPPAAFALSAPVTGTITNTANPTFSWAGSLDATSGLARYQLHVDQTINRDNIPPDTTAVTPTSALTEGLHTWKVVALDNAGNSRESNSSSVTVDTFAPVLSGLNVTGITATGATITWASNEAASSQVEYGSTSSYGSATTEADTTTRVVTHTVALAGLTPASAVHFRVKGRDQAGNWGLSTDSAFTAGFISIYLPTLAREYASGW